MFAGYEWTHLIMSVSGPGNEWAGHDRFIAETGDTQIWIQHRETGAGGGIYEGCKSARPKLLLLVHQEGGDCDQYE